MHCLTLIRGLPGSGKTTVAQTLMTAASFRPRCLFAHHEADFYFLDPEGGYHFNASKLPYVHARCQHDTLADILTARTRECPCEIFVTNTFTQLWEMLPYASMARLLGVTLRVTEPGTSWAKDPLECSRRCTHDVPRTKILQMADRWEDCSEDGTELQEQLESR